MTRKYTRMFMALCEDHAMSWEELATMCLGYMSEDDVKDMARANDISVQDDDDEE